MPPAATEHDRTATRWRAREIAALILAAAALILAIPFPPFTIILGLSTVGYCLVAILRRPTHRAVLLWALGAAALAVIAAVAFWAVFYPNAEHVSSGQASVRIALRDLPAATGGATPRHAVTFPA